MKKYWSLRGCRLTPVELADMCELYATKEMTRDQLAHKYDMARTTIDHYLDTHYHGIVPKSKQIIITLNSKI